MEISDEKMAMAAIVISLQNFTDPVAMQSISDAALMRKKELEPEQVDTDAVKFECSECLHTRIEAVMDGSHTTIIDGG